MGSEIYIVLILFLVAILLGIGITSNCVALISLILSAIAIIWTSIWTLILYKFKPKLKIEVVGGIEKHKIRIKITNENRRFDAINLNIEVCTVKKEETYHLKIDKEDFLILPHKNSELYSNHRIFKAKWKDKNDRKKGELERKLKEKGVKLRVRIHSTHSFTGFGKAEGECFEYDENANSFKNIKHTQSKLS
ncbi:MAG: hypothetical protein FWC98_05645 [Bacteroidales bacterium]|nr:hypothetical protein [Bacteroidales bacterium]